MLNDFQICKIPYGQKLKFDISLDVVYVFDETNKNKISLYSLSNNIFLLLHEE